MGAFLDDEGFLGSLRYDLFTGKAVTLSPVIQQQWTDVLDVILSLEHSHVELDNLLRRKSEMRPVFRTLWLFVTLHPQLHESVNVHLANERGIPHLSKVNANGTIWDYLDFHNIDDVTFAFHMLEMCILDTRLFWERRNHYETNIHDWAVHSLVELLSHIPAEWTLGERILSTLTHNDGDGSYANWIFDNVYMILNHPQMGLYWQVRTLEIAHLVVEADLLKEQSIFAFGKRALNQYIDVLLMAHKNMRKLVLENAISFVLKHSDEHGGYIYAILPVTVVARYLRGPAHRELRIKFYLEYLKRHPGFQTREAVHDVMQSIVDDLTHAVSAWGPSLASDLAAYNKMLERQAIAAADIADRIDTVVAKIMY